MGASSLLDAGTTACSHVGVPPSTCRDLGRSVAAGGPPAWPRSCMGASMNPRSLVLIAFGVLVCCLPIQPGKAQDGGHGQGHAENHNMYKDWKRPDVGGSCCNART